VTVQSNALLNDRTHLFWAAKDVEEKRVRTDVFWLEEHEVATLAHSPNKNDGGHGQNGVGLRGGTLIFNRDKTIVRVSNQQERRGDTTIHLPVHSRSASAEPKTTRGCP
jgi:hypothetical protein